VLLDVEDLDNVGMLQPGNRLGLDAEPPSLHGALGVPGSIT
jgi:hypothetical protein